MRRSRNKAQVFVHFLMTLIGVAAMALFMKDLIRFQAIHGFDTKGVELEGVPDEMRQQIRDWKNNADLVLVARLAGVDSQGIDRSTDAVTTYGFYWLSVEDVEKGFYLHPQIRVYIGWMSNVIPPMDYPPYLKRSYRQGDRVRIYLNLDRSTQTYYTPGAYYTVEPLDNNAGEGLPQ